MSTGVRSTSFHHLNVRRLRFAELFHAVHIKVPVLGCAKFLLRRLRTLLEMVLAQDRVLHPHHVPI